MNDLGGILFWNVIACTWETWTRSGNIMIEDIFMESYVNQCMWYYMLQLQTFNFK